MRLIGIIDRSNAPLNQVVKSWVNALKYELNQARLAQINFLTNSQAKLVQFGYFDYVILAGESGLLLYSQLAKKSNGTQFIWISDGYFDELEKLAKLPDLILLPQSKLEPKQLKYISSHTEILPLQGNNAEDFPYLKHKITEMVIEKNRTFLALIYAHPKLMIACVGALLTILILSLGFCLGLGVLSSVSTALTVSIFASSSTFFALKDPAPRLSTESEYELTRFA